MVRFIEHVTGRRALVQFYPFVAQGVDQGAAARLPICYGLTSLIRTVLPPPVWLYSYGLFE